MTNLQHALRTKHASVGRYAVVSALSEVMVMAQRAQMRAEHATGEALTDFDTALTTNDRRCRRRATDYVTLEALAATSMRKHARRRGGKDRRDRRDRDRSRDRDHSRDRDPPAKTDAPGKKNP